MFTTNLSIDDRLVNRQVGTIVGTKQDPSGISNKMYVKFEDENARLTKMKSDRYASENNMVPIVRIEASFSVSLNSGPTIHPNQFLLMLAFACTVHKVQGLTLPSIIVSFSLNRQKKFSYGQLYVALIKVKSLSNLYIEGQVTKEAFSVVPDVETDYRRLKLQYCLTTSQIAVGFSIMLLNVRSLSKHCLICLTV